MSASCYINEKGDYMNIYLIKELRGKKEEISVEKGISLEEIYRKYEDELPYTVLAAKVNNKIEGLWHRIHRECCVEFLDMRTQSGNLIYQNSLTLIYLKAIEDVIGKVEVDIENALNKGLYTEIKSKEPLTVKDIKAIENRMRELVNQDIPFIREDLSKEEAIARLDRKSVV